MGYMSSADRDGIRQAIADRERGRNKVRSATTAVTMASVVTAGALALVLPGSTHNAVASTSTGSPGSTSSSSGSSGSTSSGSTSSGSTSSGSTSSGSTSSVRQLRLDQLGLDQLGLHQLGFGQFGFGQFGLVLFFERPQFGFQSGLELG